MKQGLGRYLFALLAVCTTVALLAVCTGASPGAELSTELQALRTLTTHVATTTQPAESQSASGVWHTFLTGIKTQLRTPHLQWANALVALIAGIILIVDGEFAFKYMVVGAVFIVAMLVALNDISATWSLGYDDPIRRCVGIEVGLLCAYVAFRGIQGVMIVSGGLLGAVFAYAVQTTMLSMGYTAFETQKWLVASIYSIFIIGFMLVLERRKHVGSLAILSPVLGGALVSSAVSYFVALSKSPQAAAQAGAWIDYLLLLVDPTAPDVGVLSHSPNFLNLFGARVPTDKVIGCVLWFVLVVLGASLQIHKMMSAKTGGKGSLTRPILKDAV